MDTFVQTNNNDCGVCVLASLVQFYHNVNHKTEILNDCKIDGNGISIYNFEILGNKYGVNCETYRMENDEFVQYKNKNYFVVLKKSNNYLHYQIIKKHKQDILIYENGQVYKQNCKEFLSEFAGIVILTNKIKVNIKRKKHFFVENIKFCVISLLLQLISIIFTMMAANFFSVFLNNVLSNNSFNNLISISFLFLVIFLCSGLTKLTISLYENNYKKNNFLLLSNLYLEKILNKSVNFKNKFNLNNLYLIDHSINTIVTYENVTFINFISSVISSTVIMLYLCFVDYHIILFCIILSILMCIISYFEWKYKKNLLESVISNNNTNSKYTSDLINSIEQNNTSSIAIENLKKNYSYFSRLNFETNKFDSFVSSSIEFSQKLIQILFLVFVFFYYNSVFNNDIGQVILICTFFSIFSSNLSHILYFPNLTTEYKKMKQIYDETITLENNELLKLGG